MRILRLLIIMAIALPLHAQILLEENFDYPAGDSLRAHGWNITGTSTLNTVLVSNAGLTYPGYPLNSGNSAVLQTTGQDVNRGFLNNDSVNSGSVYASFLVNISAAQTAGDYFFHFGIATDNSSIFLGRVFAKLDNGNVAFGLSKSSTNATVLPVYTTTTYPLNTTHLIVLKYTFFPEATDDSVYLFINPVLNSSEPLPNLAHSTLTTGSDPLVLKTVCLRQGSSANAANLILDGIKVSRSWSMIVPVELTSFTASAKGRSVTLNWTTASEINNKGFYVEFAKKGSEFREALFIEGKGSTTEKNDYSAVIPNLSNGRYEFRLRQVDFDGTITYSPVVEATILTTGSFVLDQNYPNPFNPSTTITFQLPEDADVSLKLYNVMGQEIKTVLNKRMTAGSHSIALDADDLSAGVYLYQLKAGSYTSTKKLTLVK